MPAIKKRRKKEAPDENKPLYEEVSVRLCIGEDDQLTAEQARKLIGWQPEGEGRKYGREYLLRDEEGVKIRCTNNVTNRPFYSATCKGLIQDILQGNWRFNGEPIIVGNYGYILNGQHTLVALILANQIWSKSPDSYPHWETPPTIAKVVVFGVPEDDKTVNTMDTCKPRSLADVLYRSPFFSDFKAAERKKVAKTCSFAIRTIWDRLGIKQGLSVITTHSELLSFLERHKRILEAVSFVQIENGQENNLLSFGQLGVLSGLFYLMCCSNTNPEEYRKDPIESSLSFDNWSKAEDFFVLVSSRAKVVEPLYTALRKIGEGSRKERSALLVKAWTQWVSAGSLDEPVLRYVEKEGVKLLAETPLVGGIDGIFLDV